ncbi:MAG: glycosyl hydrolase family 17 protein, partial [Bacteroidota bacterium]
AHRHGLKTVVGAWISNDRERNKREVASLINLCKAGYVDIAVVGNEVLLREELSEKEVISYLEYVRQQTTGIPVTYIDAYYQLLQRPGLAAACDVLLVNCYPFWEGCDIEDAAAYLQYMYHLVKDQAQGKEVMIAETGWPSEGSTQLQAVPNKANAIKYFVNTTKWQQKENVPLFYFSSFDESWKARQEGDVGARWGLWDKNEKLKYS